MLLTPPARRTTILCLVQIALAVPSVVLIIQEVNVVSRHADPGPVYALAAAEFLLLFLPALVVISYYRSGPPQEWLVHLTSLEACSAITAGQPSGIVHLQAGRRIAGRSVPLFGAHPFRSRIYFFDRARPARWQWFNLAPDRRAVAIFVRAQDLAGGDNPRFFRRRFLDSAVAWPGADYLGPARIEPASADNLIRRFGPS